MTATATAIAMLTAPIWLLAIHKLIADACQGIVR
jgi:hypothetical protein